MLEKNSQLRDYIDYSIAQISSELKGQKVKYEDNGRIYTIDSLKLDCANLSLKIKSERDEKILSTRREFDKLELIAEKAI